MDIKTLTQFFIWCTIINSTMLMLSTLMLAFAPTLVYRIQSKLFPIPRETFTVLMYSFLGLYKIVLIVFCIVPMIALLIIG